MLDLPIIDVEQCDRNAAFEIASNTTEWRGTNIAKGILLGKRDSNPLVQTLARYRLALAGGGLVSQRLATMQEAAQDVLSHRVGDLPTLGYLRDNDASRAALARLAALITKKDET